MGEVLVLAALQLLLPLLLAAWLWRAGGWREWALLAVALAGLVGAIGSAGLWLALPPPLFLLPLGAALLAPFGAPLRWRRGAVRGTPRGRLALAGLLALPMMALGAHALSGRLPPRGVAAVEMRFPLAGGIFFVANGGAVDLLNPHVGWASEPRLASFRGQGHALDLVALDRWGRRADGLRPGDPARYAAFGAAVLSPCAGTVLLARDGLPDLPPPRADRAQPTGNHLLIDCGAGVHVLLAHLRQGSLTVAEGAVLREGQRVGALGNSGNTAEPHLHIHAQRPGPPGAPFAGDPLPLRLDGRYLARNALILRPAPR